MENHKKPNSEKRKPKGPIKFKIDLNEEQKHAKTLIYDNTVILLKGNAGSGKAQPLDSLVLTPSGYQKMGDLKEGELVVTPDGKSAPILGIFPQGMKDIYKITFNDGTYTFCCREHLWNVQHRNNKHVPSRRNGYKNTNHGKYVTVSIDTLLSSSLQDSRGLNKWYIPITSPIEFDSPWIENKIDPYILGCVLGDGHLGKHGVVLTSADKQIIEEFESYCKNHDMKIASTGWGYDYRITEQKKQDATHWTKSTLARSLDGLGLLGTRSQTKFIPKEYLIQSIEDRVALLQGLLDTDGGIEAGCIVFNTTSVQLVDDVKFLVHSLGGIVRISSRPCKLNRVETGSTTYRANIVLPSQFARRAFRLSRKQVRLRTNKKEPQRSIKSIEFFDRKECQCIYVDSDEHLYLTDNMIVTHNTLAAVHIALDMFFKREIEKIVITRPVVAAADEIGFLPGDIKQKMDPWLAPIYANLYTCYDREVIDEMVIKGDIEILPFAFVRGRTLVNACVIVDEAQNVTQSQTEMIIGRLGKGSRMIFCGDTSQIDLKIKKESGIDFFKTLEARVEGVKTFVLKENHRHPIVPQILDIYKEYHS